uniref:Uncharacterized protein n=1 Tax=Magnetospirillum gryphiswaldense TaxID=55518 RepID=A4U4T4_9PROT|nr:hypothetical protein MGR_3959 [Magnetospirillum gryphiswaldense MSR-1]
MIDCGQASDLTNVNNVLVDISFGLLTEVKEQ